jgi:hypothetical protein
VDWDSDGDKDLIVGENNGHVRYYQNIGTAGNPQLHYVGLMQAGGLTISVGTFSTTCVNDWNQDGLMDLLVGESEGVINLFLNNGTPTNPSLAAGTFLTLWSGVQLDVGSRSAPAVADFNGDGVKDLVSGEADGKVYYYHNSGTNANPILDAGVFLQNGSLQLTATSTSRPAAVDWDSDGHMDLVVGSYDARLRRYNWAVSTPAAPTCDAILTSSYIVPASGGTITYTLTVTNGSAPTVHFDAWTQIQNPDLTWTDLFCRPRLSLAPGGSLTRNLSLIVPASWPSGTYYLSVYAGNNASHQICSEDCFTFKKNTICESSGQEVREFSFTTWESGDSNFSESLPDMPEMSVYPNPFNPSITVGFELDKDLEVKVSVYNIAGQHLALLANSVHLAGNHQITWDASHLPAGLYIITMDAGSFHSAKKVSLLK